MPCDDLISLKDTQGAVLQAEANRFLEESSRFLIQQSRNKRQCRSFGDSTSTKIADKTNPATAALEAALRVDDALFDSCFDSELVQISLLSSWASDASFFSTTPDYVYPDTCTKQMHKSSAIPSVNTVDNVAGILSKLTTAPTVAWVQERDSQGRYFIQVNQFVYKPLPGLLVSTFLSSPIQKCTNNPTWRALYTLPQEPTTLAYTSCTYKSSSI